MNPASELLLLKAGVAVCSAFGALLTPWARKLLEKYLPKSDWWGAACIVLLIGAALCGALIPFVPSSNPEIELTGLPPPPPWTEQFAPISGRATGTFDPASTRVVVYANASGQWYIQPTVTAPFATIGTDGFWTTNTHPGSAYAALLVKATHRPASTCLVLPQVGGEILAIAQ